MDKKTREQRIKEMEEREYKVVKANRVIQKTSSTMTLNEQKLVMYCISKIKKGDDKDKEYSIAISDFRKIMNLSKTGKFSAEIKASMKKIADKSTWFFDVEDGADNLIRWFQDVKIKNGVIFFKYDTSIHKYLFGLKDYFTTFELWNVMLLTTKYSISLYEYLKSFSNLKVFEVELNEFRSKCNIKYTRYTDIRRYILENSVKEINEKTDIRVEYKPLKKGRKVSGIEFKIDVLGDADKNERHHQIENAIKMGVQTPLQTNLTL